MLRERESQSVQALKEHITDRTRLRLLLTGHPSPPGRLGSVSGTPHAGMESGTITMMSDHGLDYAATQPA
jgi:hypothetical protein